MHLPQHGRFPFPGRGINQSCSIFPTASSKAQAFLFLQTFQQSHCAHALLTDDAFLCGERALELMVLALLCWRCVYVRDPRRATAAAVLPPPVGLVTAGCPFSTTRPVTPTRSTDGDRVTDLMMNHACVSVNPERTHMRKSSSFLGVGMAVFGLSPPPPPPTSLPQVIRFTSRNSNHASQTPS